MYSESAREKAATPESGTDFAVASPLRPFHAILLRCVRNAAEKENRGKEEGGRKERATKKSVAATAMALLLSPSSS